MKSDELVTVTSQIAGLLKQCGYADRAAWLDARIAELTLDSASDGVRASVKRDLHGIVHGMGGLLDLSLHPEPGSDLSPKSARERLDGLSEILFRLTE